MKICVLMGSPRKKDSYRICRLLEEFMNFEQDTVFEYLFLNDYKIEDCRGCGLCFQRGEEYCPCKDELHIVREKMAEADGIILASPVYACQITGLMKRALDRLSYLFHRQQLVGKPALTVVTTDGGGQKAASAYLKMTACGWGCRLIGQQNIISPMFFNDEKRNSAWKYSEKYHDSQIGKIKDMAKRFAGAASERKTPTPSFYDIFMFQCLRSKMFASKADYDYWKAKGWLESDYFYGGKLRPAKRWFAGAMRAFVDRAARRRL